MLHPDAESTAAEARRSLLLSVVAADAESSGGDIAMALNSNEHMPLRPEVASGADTDDDESGLRRPGRRGEPLCSAALLRVLLVGQLLSLLVTGSGVFSQLLSARGVNIPTSQSFANYAVLSLFMLPRLRKWIRARRDAARTRRVGLAAWDGIAQVDDGTVPPRCDNSDCNGLAAPAPASSQPPSAAASAAALPALLAVAWWKYLFLAAADVEGNFLLVKAYQYTTITSVQLLDCFTIPLVMLLGRVVLRARYNRKHLLGASICLVGLVLLILSDLLSKRNEGEMEEQNKRE